MSALGLKSRFATLCLLLLCGVVVSVSAIQLWHAGTHCTQAAQATSTGGGPLAVRAVIVRLWVQGAFMALAGLLLAILVAVPVTWYACSPVEDLAEATSAMAEGDWSRRAAENGPADLTRIARSVNRLASLLASQSAAAEAKVQESRVQLLVQTQELETQLLLRERAESELREAKETAEAAAEELRLANEHLKEELKEAERAATRAEVANHVKSEFLADMSHGIRTPLTAILGFAETMLDSSLTDAERVDGATTIKRNGEHLLAVVNDILDLSRIEAGTLDVHHEICSVFQVVADVQSVMYVQADAKKLTFDVDYIGDLPATIQTDPARLRQILINVLNDAMDYSDLGGIHLLVQFSDVGLEPVLIFEVVGTGLGMAAEVVQRLFTPYAHGTVCAARCREGSGLSLAISKQLASLLGGDLTAENVPDQGMVFRLSISTGPLDGVEMVYGQEHAIVVKHDCPDSKTGVAEDQRLDVSVLLAEDGPDNQRLISKVLTKVGARVTCAADGREALELVHRAMAKGNPYGIILMDMEMPRMDGYSATNLLRTEGYDGPIIALTANALAGDREKCVNAGCDDYVSKPIDRPKLIAVLTGWVGKRSQHVPANAQA